MTEPAIELFVDRALMRKLALLTPMTGAEFIGACRTAAGYRLHSVRDVDPGMFAVDIGSV
jgi:hypothetical protein